MRDRLLQLDILKALAIIAVILIHTTSLSFKYLGNQNLPLIFDQFLRFSVPLFVAVSGYLLAQKYLQATFTFQGFFKKRVLKLLPPYLMATAFIYFYLHYLTQEPQQNFNIFQIIFFGRADYHLYFVPMLFQLYLLFPLILYFYKKARKTTIIAALIIQIAVILISQLIQKHTVTVNFLWGDQQQYLFSLTWIFYFVIGSALFDLNNSKPKIFKKLKVIAPLLLVSGFVLAAASAQQNFKTNNDLIRTTNFNRIPVLLYASGFITTALVWQDKILNLFGITQKFLVSIGQKSYSIYLIHTVVIRFVYQNFKPNNFLSFVIFSLIVIYVSLIIAHILSQLSLLWGKRTFLN